MSSSTIFVTQEGPANALALNKDWNQVVIAGRNVFKVFSLDENEFQEICNLRVGKNLNLNFSCNDVAWNSIDDHILATAATNGAVVVWNLNKLGRSKQEHVFIDHKRTVNKVNFHMTEPSLLLSGSQDGTMKCFDLRNKEIVKTFFSNTESVRDVQFSPHSSQTFAAVSENGNVQLWDIRKPDRCNQQFTAHSGPIFACDWHPETNWLATASRDKTIKVWDLSGKPTLEYTIHTIASVGHIKWRPQRKYHIASCALVVDCSVNVWDVRRPFIPYATFDEHKDVATGVAWKGNPHCFLSTSRDNTLYRHVFKDANRPASKANPQGISLNNKGDIVHACKVITYAPYAPRIQLIRKISIMPDQFDQATSVLNKFTNLSSQDDSLYQCATRYMLTGKSLSEICDHNAAVAKDLGKTHVCAVWNIIKTLYGNISDQSNVSRDDMSNSHNHAVLEDQCSIKGIETPGAIHSDDTEAEEVVDTIIAHQMNGYVGVPPYPLGALAPRGDFIFGENELDMEFDRMTNTLGLRDGLLTIAPNIGEPQDWTLPAEAFPLRHELQDRSPPPEQFPNNAMDITDDAATVTVEDQPSSLLTITSLPKINAWDPSSVIVETLKYHAQLGDVQTSVSILLVLKERRPSVTLLSEAVQEHWTLGYLDLLGRHRLWNVAAQVIKLCWIPSIHQLNQQSTTIYTNCGRCCKPLQRSGWLCDRCHSSDSALCGVCHQVVRGLYVWCQECSHGGHLAHIRQWMENNRLCPTGCGHSCEYS